MAYIYDLTDTWNAGGTTFNGIKLNVTDSASAVSSKLVALQTNGTEHFSVTKAGVGYFSGNVGIGTSSPAEKLQIQVNTGTSGLESGITLTNGVDANLFSYVTGTAAADKRALITVGATAQSLAFGTLYSERMRILADGNVLVGRTTAYGQAYRMVVNGDSGASAIPMAINDDRSGTADSRILAFLRGGTETGYITSSNNTLAIAGSTTLTFQTVSSEQMRITNTGNVGIGTSTANNRLVVDNGGVTVKFSGSPTLDLGNAFMHIVGNPSTAGGFRLGMGWNVGFDGTNWRTGGDGANNGGAYIASNYGVGALDFYTVGATGGSSQTISDASFAATKRMTIDASGNLLVGTTEANPTNGFVANPNSGNGFYTQTGHPNGTSSGVAYARFMYAQTEIGSITQNGTTGVLYNVSSDARLKKNITNADEASGLIDALQVRKFDWKSDNSHQAYGFIAQELLTVAPEAVSQPADPDDMMGVDYSKLVPMLVKEIQSMRLRLAQLEGTA